MLKALRIVARTRGALGVLLGSLILLAPGTSWTQDGDSDPDIEIITHPQRVDAGFKKDTLRALFSMRQRSWPNGERVQVFVFPDHSRDHQHFCKHMLGTFPYVLRAIWDRLVFTGTGFAPIEVQSAEEMRRRVRQTPGAIGYIVHRRKHIEGPVSLLADTQPATDGETP